jgi:hypothetical protein
MMQKKVLLKVVNNSNSYLNITGNHGNNNLSSLTNQTSYNSNSSNSSPLISYLNQIL